jgi:hypothetical protein
VWALSEAIAPTLSYDDAVLGDGTVPPGEGGPGRCPVLVLDGEASPAPLRHASAATAEAPDARSSPDPVRPGARCALRSARAGAPGVLQVTSG